MLRKYCVLFWFGFFFHSCMYCGNIAFTLCAQFKIECCKFT